MTKFMPLESLHLNRDYPALVYKQNKFYNNKMPYNAIYWHCCKKNSTNNKIPCVTHTNLERTDVQKRILNHNHPPTCTKNPLQRERCTEATSLHDMSVK